MSSQESDILSQETYQYIANHDGFAGIVAQLESNLTPVIENEVSQDYSDSTQIPEPQPEGNGPEILPIMAESDASSPPHSGSSATGTLPPIDDHIKDLCTFNVDPEKSHNLKFSPLLKKIFLKPEKVVPFRITWDVPKCVNNGPNLYVRAMLVYKDHNRFPEAVKRCAIHRDGENPWNKDFEHITDHVIISVNDMAEHVVNDSSERRSIIVPLQQSDCMSNLIYYKFMCLTSCSRSDMEIIFTLENDSGSVLGRRKLGVKICMAPERDQKKEEQKCVPEGMTGKRKRKVITEPEETAVKKEPIDPSCSFMVVAASPSEATRTKDLLKKYNVYQKALKGRAPIEKIIDNNELSAP